MLCINFSAWFCLDAAASTISLLCGSDEPQKTAVCIVVISVMRLVNYPQKGNVIE